MHTMTSRWRSAAFAVVAAVVAAVVSACFAGCDESGTEADAEAEGVSVRWEAAPPARVTAGEAFQAAWRVETSGDIHVSELRACRGVVADCGLEGSDERVFAEGEGGVFSADLALPSAGSWTVVAWVHVDQDPHVSGPMTVEVE